MSTKAPIRRTAAAIARPLAWVAGFSFLMNIIYLAAPIYMMQVYDRVLHSRSVPTLVFLTVAVSLCFATFAVLDAVRGRIIAAISDIVEGRLGVALLSALTSAPQPASAAPAGVHVSRDLDTIRQFAAGTGPLALVDLPWVPVYLAVIALLHPMLAVFAAAAATVLMVLALVTERCARGPMIRSGQVATRAYQFGEAIARNGDCARTMGLGETLTRRWRDLRGEMLAAQNTASSRVVVLGAMGKFLRMLFQSTVLGIGAWLTIRNEMSGGAIFAGSLLLGRMLAPIEALIVAWRPAIAAREALSRIRPILEHQFSTPAPTALPPPLGALHLENVSWTPHGAEKPVVRDVAVQIQAGAVLTIIGASAAGKSTVARLMSGAIHPGHGVVRLDGADLRTWSPGQLGCAVGFLPQDVSLFPGTIRDNIARFGDATDAEVISAAKSAHAHEMIIRLPKGYSTVLDDGSTALSGGQRQRVALARALLGDPAVVVLDEPNANLDTEGEAALAQCVIDLKKRKRTVVMVTHRIGLVRISDYVATMHEGAMVGVQRASEFLASQSPAVVAGGRA